MNKKKQNTSEIPAYIREMLHDPPDILRGFHSDDLLDFLEIGIKEDYKNNDVIINKSDYVNSAYLVCKGSVAVWDEDIELATLHEKSFMGETFLFSDTVRMSKIVSVDDSLLLRFQRHDMLQFFKKKPAKLFNIFTRNIIYIQQQKIKSMNSQLLRLKKKLLENEIQH